MPGESLLMSQLQIGRETVRAAMLRLEKEGILEPSGRGKRRKIIKVNSSKPSKKIRVRLLAYEKEDRGRMDCASLVADLLAAGIDADFTGKSLKELGMELSRVTRYVRLNPADAWIICAASREIIEWFSQQATPAIAMYGSQAGLPIAGAYPQMLPGQTAAVRRLIELGHKRIVMLARAERRKPKPGRPEQLFLDQLEAAGIKTSEYNLPDWNETREGLARLLDGLIRFSPPTAYIFQEAQFYIAVKSYLSDKGIIAPRDVSLVVADDDPCFAWCSPIPSHISWDFRLVVRYIIQWVKKVANGKVERKQAVIGSEFIEGGTIGVVRKDELLQ